MNRGRIVPVISVCLAMIAAVSCEVPPCGPTDPDPLCNSVSLVELTSPVDSVMAVGRNVQMQALARDANGGVISLAVFAWTSTNTTTAQVGATNGFVSALNPGTTEIRAQVVGTEARGFLRMRAVAADFDAIDGAFEDPLFLAIRNALSNATQSDLASSLTTCPPNLAAGNVLGVRDCLNTALSVNGTASEAGLVGALDLFLEYAKLQLALDS